MGRQKQGQSALKNKNSTGLTLTTEVNVNDAIKVNGSWTQVAIKIILNICSHTKLDPAP